MKYAAAIILISSLFACQPLETGDPPTFSGFEIKSVSPTQIQVSWNPGSDDLLAPDELTYGIWVAGPGETIATDSAPDFVTAEGAESYSLIGLTPETAYTILVRARERGNGAWSENADTRSTGTITASESLYGTEITRAEAITNPPNALISGKVTSDVTDSLGVVFDDTIEWLDVDESGFGAIQTIEFSRDGGGSIGTILEAHLINSGGAAFDDLFLLTNIGLHYFQNEETETGERIFNEKAILTGDNEPLAGTLSFVQDNQEGLLLVFINNGENKVVAFNTETFAAESKGRFGTNAATAIGLADLNADGFFDGIQFEGNALKVFPGETEQFTFSSTAEEIANPTNSDGTDIDLTEFDGSSLHLESNGDNAIVYLSDTDEGTTLLWHFKKDLTNYFGDGQQILSGTSAYASPLLENHDGNTTMDLMLVHTSGNNVAIHKGITSEECYYGVEGTPRFFVTGNFAGTDALDLMIMNTQNELTVFFKATAATSKMAQ